MSPGARDTTRTAALLGLVAAGAHATALAGGFVWDDFTHVEHALASPFDLQEVFLPGARFRPLLYLPGAFDAVVWGERAAGWHLTTLLLHAACAAVLYLLLRRLLAARTGAEPAAIAGAALFALHPATSEVAAWIMGRGDSLSLLLGLLAAHAAMSRRPLAMALLVFGSLLAKETGVVWLVLAPACAWSRKGDRNGKEEAVSHFWPLGVGALGAAGVYFGIRASVLNGAGAPALSFSMPALLGGAGFYARAAVLPLHYRPFVEDVPVSASFVVAGIVAVLASAAAALVAVKRRSAVGGLALGGAWLALLPAVLTAGNPVSSNAVADRHLYAALPWLCLGVAAAWERVHRGAPAPRRRATLLLVTAVVLGLCAGLSLLRDRVWHDEQTLWTAVLRDAPESRYAWGNLGLAAAYAGDFQEAEEAFKSAQSARDPQPFLRVDTGAQLAMLFLSDGRTSEARLLLDGLRGVPADGEGKDALLRAEALHALVLAPGGNEGRPAPPRAAELATALAGSALRRRDPLTAWHLARILEARGDRDGAREALALVSTLAGPASRGLAGKAEERRESLVTEP